MKDNKICFSRTLAYLVLLVAVVVGAFYVMNYANSQKIGSEPKAGGIINPTIAADCTSKINKVAKKFSDGTCTYYSGGTRSTALPDYGYCNVKYAYQGECNGKNVGDLIGSVPTLTTVTCTANKIVSKWTNVQGVTECQYEKGPGILTGGRCSLGYTSGVACSPAVLTPLAGTTPTCTVNEITEKGTNTDGSEWCRYKTGLKSGTRCLVNSATGAVCAPAVGSTLATAPTLATVTCTANKITSKWNNAQGVTECQYEKGPGILTGGRCSLGYTSGAACVPAVGSVLAGLPTCTANKITSKWNNAQGVTECQYEKGLGLYTGNRCSLGYISGAACASAVGSTLAAVVAPTATITDCLTVTDKLAKELSKDSFDRRQCLVYTGETGTRTNQLGNKCINEYRVEPYCP